VSRVPFASAGPSAGPMPGTTGTTDRLRRVHRDAGHHLYLRAQRAAHRTVLLIGCRGPARAGSVGDPDLAARAIRGRPGQLLAAAIAELALSIDRRLGPDAAAWRGMPRRPPWPSVPASCGLVGAA
jgi:hypothetical protein